MPSICSSIQLLGITRALIYLHLKCIVHGDLEGVCPLAGNVSVDLTLVDFIGKRIGYQ